MGQTHHSRRRTDVSQAGPAREAVNRALKDAKLTIADIDPVVVATGPVLFAAVNQPERWVADAIGASLKPLMCVRSDGGAGLAGALSAYYQIAGGFADRVPVVAYDKLSDGALQYSISTLYDPFWSREFAVGIMGFSAAYWRSRMEPLGHTEEAAAIVAVNNRRSAMLNPYAHVKKEVTVEEVLNSKPLAWPIKLLDVPPISDGAAAIVLPSEDKAAQATDRPAWIRGMGYFCEADNAPARSMSLDFYTKALAALERGKVEPVKEHTLGWLVTEFEASTTFLKVTPREQRNRHLLVRSILDEETKPGSGRLFRDCPLKFFDGDSVRVIRDRKSATPSAANHRLANLRVIFNRAMEERSKIVKTNPVIIRLRARPASGPLLLGFEETEGGRRWRR